jgi:hypothetical protein
MTSCGPISRPDRALEGRGLAIVFLGADIDAYWAARQFGILKESTIACSGKHSGRTMYVLAETSTRFVLGDEGQMRFTERGCGTSSQSD